MLGESPLSSTPLAAEGNDVLFPETIAFVTVTAAGVLKSALLADGVYAEVSVTAAGALNAAKLPTSSAEVSVTATAWLSPLFIESTAALTWSTRTVSSNVEARNATAALTWPSRSLAAYSGAAVDLRWPDRSLTIVSTLEAVATAELTWTERTLVAEVLSNGIGTVALLWPAEALTIYGGGVSELSWPTKTLTATGSLDTVSTINLTWPVRILSIDGLLNGVGTATLAWPARTLTVNGLTGGLVVSALTWPARVLFAVGSSATTETTYAINLSSGAVTQLILGEFTKLVTAHGRLYGLRSDGSLVYLDGDDDEGVAIPAEIRLAPQTFGTNRPKRMSAVYLSSREDDGMYLDVIADEVAEWRYQTATDAAPAFGTHRIKTGRGIKFHTAGLRIKNRTGGRLDIGGIEALIDVLLPRPLT